MKIIPKIFFITLTAGHLTGSIYRLNQGDLIVGITLLGAALSLGTISWQRIFGLPSLKGRKVLRVLRITGLAIATFFLVVYIFYSRR